MNRFFIQALGLLAVSCPLVACSGTDGSNLDLDSGGTTPQPEAGSPTDASVPTDTGPSNDATTPPDTGPADVVVDVTPDTPTGPPDSLVQCGPSVTCSAQTQVCCWHMTNTSKPYECVSDVSACGGVYDVPITCSTNDNCTSQGNPSYQCCATGGNVGSGMCSTADIATVVACKSSCTDVDDYPIGCSVTLQNCSDPTETCIVSKCTDPGATLCTY